MSEYPLTLEELMTWLGSTEAVLEGKGISLVGLRKNSEFLPSAGADYDTKTMTGGIRCWVNGLFDFEVYRLDDGKLVFFRHEEVSRLDSPSLQAALDEFLRILLSPA